MALIISGKALSGLRKMRPGRAIEGHDKFLDTVCGPGHAAAARQHARDFRRHYADDPQRGYAPDKSLRHVATIPAEMFMFHEIATPGCWEDQSFVQEILTECPDFIVNPNTQTARGLKAPSARR